MYDIRGADGTGTSANPVANDSANAISYTVRKLADGNCWMTSNLRLPLATGVPVEASYNDRSTFDWSPMNCSASANCAMNNSTLYWSGTDQYYYNWYAATAEKGTTEDISVDADGSICPKGWKLPSNYNFDHMKSFSSITNAYFGFVGNMDVNYVSGLESIPLSFSRTGHSWTAGQVQQINAFGLYWSSSSTGISSSYSNQAYRFRYTAGTTYPQDYYSSMKYYLGYPVRCVAI